MKEILKTAKILRNGKPAVLAFVRDGGISTEGTTYNTEIYSADMSVRFWGSRRPKKMRFVGEMMFQDDLKFFLEHPTQPDE